ncbi:MAG: aromatic ring-hydroxylating dioxygenase subunit alpha [Ilumatobacteraceae bacterium]
MATYGVLASSPTVVNGWYAVARSVEVTQGVALAVRLLERDLVLWRGPDGAAVAAPDRCPHREAPLSAGTVDDGCLSCAYHGWTFAAGGHCVRVPSNPESVPPPPRAHLVAHHCVERYGLAWVCLGEPAGDVPCIEQEADPAFRRINAPVEPWRTSATRMVDNFLDISHFPYVHTGTFGRAQDTLVPKVEITGLDGGWTGYRYEVLANNADAGTLASGQAAGVVERSMTTGFQLPFHVRSTIRYDTGLEHVLLLLSAPVDDVTSLFTFVVWRNDDFSVSAEEVIRFDLAIGAEDKRMLELVPGLLPLDQTTLVSVQADRCSVEWRRRLAASLQPPATR